MKLCSNPKSNGGKNVRQVFSQYFTTNSNIAGAMISVVFLLASLAIISNTLVLNLYQFYYNYNPFNLHSCDCTNDKISKRLLDNACCKRSLIYVHKMGVAASKKILKRHFPQIPRGEFANHEKDGVCHKRCDQVATRTPSDAADYRFIVITRNWYDSLISGYLYHRKGSECWLDGDGNSYMGFFSGWLHNNKLENWEHRINQTAAPGNEYPWPPGRGRDLCRYLQDESEFDGLRVYIEWSLDIYLRPLMKFTQDQKQSEKAAGLQKTLFVCYEDMTKQYDTIHQNFTLWYTNGRPYQFPHKTVSLHKRDKVIKIPKGETQARRRLTQEEEPKQNITQRFTEEEQQQALETVYVGGHSTNHDPEYRKKLYSIIHQLDKELFHGELWNGITEFGCPGKYEDLIYKPKQ